MRQSQNSSIVTEGDGKNIKKHMKEILNIYDQFKDETDSFTEDYCIPDKIYEFEKFVRSQCNDYLVKGIGGKAKERSRNQKIEESESWTKKFTWEQI